MTNAERVQANNAELREAIETAKELPDAGIDTSDAVFIVHSTTTDGWLGQKDSYTSVTIGDGTTIIGSRAFEGCSNLQSVSISDSVTNIGDYAFKSCTLLSNINIPDSVTRIGDYAFAGCGSISRVTIPEGVTKLQQDAFWNCSSLTSVTFKGTPLSISSYAFESCNNLTTINVPWVEGAVANAPWGATNATINYNYTEG